MPEPRISFGDTANVDMSCPQPVSIEDIRRRRRGLPADGFHQWVVASLYSVEEPEIAMDDMVLDENSFVGVTNIHCIWCEVPYSTRRRGGRCE